MSFQEIQGNVIIYLFPYQNNNLREYHLLMKVAQSTEFETNFLPYLKLIEPFVRINSDRITIVYLLSKESKNFISTKLNIDEENINEFNSKELGDLENLIQHLLGEEKFQENKKYILSKKN